MIISRLAGFIFRFAEFVCSAVVLGLNSHFLHQYRHTHVGPKARLIYTEVIAVLGLLLSLVWLIPSTSALLHSTADLLMTGAWFAVFALLVNYIERIGCGGAFHWEGLYHNTTCNQWKATEAFSFIGACFWLASALLGFWVYSRLGRNTAPADTTHRRRRWGRRSYV